jgi:hypothetical protein
MVALSFALSGESAANPRRGFAELATALEKKISRTTPSIPSMLRAHASTEPAVRTFTRLMDAGGAMLWGRVTYEIMECCWPAIARGYEEAPPALREWAVELEAKPKYVVAAISRPSWTGWI